MCFTRFVLCIVLSCLPVYFLCLFCCFFVVVFSIVNTNLQNQKGQYKTKYLTVENPTNNNNNNNNNILNKNKKPRALRFAPSEHAQKNETNLP